MRWVLGHRPIILRLVASLVVAAVTFALGLRAGRIDVNGGMLSDLPLIIGLIVGVVASAVVGIVALRGRARTLTTGLLVAGAWAGYLGGNVVAHLAGPSVETFGTLHVSLGAPFGNDVQFEATCTSVVGDPSVLAWISTDTDAPHGFSVSVHDPFTGASGDGVSSLFTHPSLLVADLSDNTRPGSVVELPRSLYYGPSQELVEEGPRRGILTATYQLVPGGVNPGSWPSTFVMRAEWSCPDLGVD